MNQLFVYGLLIFGAYYMFTGGAGILERTLNKDNVAYVLGGLTKTELYTKIQDYYEKDVLHTVSQFYADTIETSIADLNNDGKKDVIAVVRSPLTCRDGECLASIFLLNEEDELTAVPFTISVESIGDIEVLENVTEGMHDLRVNQDETNTMVWNGTTYVPKAN